MKRVCIPDVGRFENYVSALERVGAEVAYAVGEVGFDALLLPGGGDLEPWRYGEVNRGSTDVDPARDTLEWMLLEQFLAANKPILGICRGMQLLNVYLGGSLHQDISGHSSANGTDRYHKVYSTGELAEVCGKAAMLNSAHHQAVKRLGAGLVPIQWAADGVIEGVADPMRHVLGVQWHPERMDRNFADRFFQWFLEKET